MDQMKFPLIHKILTQKVNPYYVQSIHCNDCTVQKNYLFNSSSSKNSSNDLTLLLELVSIFLMTSLVSLKDSLVLFIIL